MKKYEQVSEYIKEKILSGKFAVGSKLPSEDDLIKILGISRSPVRKALQELTDQKYIYKIQGSGSYVKELAIHEPVNIYAILQNKDVFVESRIIQGMRKAIDDSSFKNIHLILKNPGKNTVKQIEVLNMIPVTGEGGVICVPMCDESRAANRLLGANLRKIEKGGFPVILLDKNLPEYHGSSISSDHQSGAREMINFLLSCGHQNVAVIYTHHNTSSIKQRLEGIRQAFDSNEGAPGRFSMINNEEVAIDSTFIEDLIKNDITTVFCLECSLAREIYEIAEAEGYNIPEDFSLCSFDELCFHDIRSDFLTTVTQRFENIGYLSVQLLLNKIEGKTTGNVHILVESDLRRRKSVKAI